IGRRGARFLEGPDDDRVDLWVRPLDPGNGLLDQFRRRDLTRPHQARHRRRVDKAHGDGRLLFTPYDTPSCPTVPGDAGSGRSGGWGHLAHQPPPRRLDMTATTPVVTMKQLLEAGVHFGHQTRRWNPKMRPYIFGERNGIYIIDLQKTLEATRVAYEFVRTSVAGGGSILFVGTKKQAQDPVAENARRVGMPYVNFRWLGGMLTNFA